MRRRVTLLAVLLLCSWALSSLAQAQPRPQVFQLHTAEAGNVNGTVISTFGYPTVTVDNSIAAAWDGVANYEGNFPSIGWIAVQCVNQATNLVVTTTTGAASVRCNITGAQQFRARVSGRTVGTVTATAAIMSGGESGVGAVTVDDTLVDDTPFTVATDRVFPVGYLVDDAGSDTADEGDIGVARMSPTRVMRTTPGNDAGTPVTYGAGAVAATTPRTTLASDDPAVVALQIIDDWDETNRAAVNLIAGQVAITAGAGAVAANTPRTTLASDDPAVVALQIIDDWDETNRAAVNTIAGQVGVQGGAGAATALTQRVALATDANVVDTELPTAVALSDTIANPTAPAVGAFLMGWDGTDWDRVATVSALGDASSVGLVGIGTYLFNGSTWARSRETSSALNSTGVGIVASAMVAQLDDTSPSTLTENQFGNVRLSTRRALHVEAVGAQITLQASQVSAIVNGTTTRTTTTGLAGFRDMAILINITGAGVVTGTLQLFLQDSQDGGTTWDDIVASNTFVFGAATTTQRFFISGRIATTATQGSAVANETLVAGTVRNGPWGDRLRVREVITGIGGTPTGVTYTISAVPK